ncbi:hypothetical protein TorRG33x02_053340 [Trema orientale]|uniref:Uncharacterized protein n=1 Tax=Trema orientale TaxID=63057 RepID=A0A2P5FMQ6_TREOI|nr:hypothetical protein TorRG33x02_053340 [Trema orientale]
MVSVLGFRVGYLFLDFVSEIDDRSSQVQLTRAYLFNTRTRPENSITGSGVTRIFGYAIITRFSGRVNSDRTGGSDIR